MHPDNEDQNGYQQRESMMPIIQSDVNDASQGDQRNLEGTHRTENLGNANDDGDMIEQLWRESVDIRINPVGMRRVLFNLKKTYK